MCADNSTLPVGTIVAERYCIERLIGRGGMASVYLARDQKHGRDVALKFLAGPYPDPVAVRRFLREIVTLAQLAHPHILPLYDSGEEDGALYFVMPYVPGGSLRTRLLAEKTLPVAEVARFARELADALSFAHARGYVHRDIKPENVLLSSDGHALLADFGIVRADTAIGDPALTATGVGLGTPAYMSPEQACGDPADARSDLYSLASVLYEALVGEPPVSPRGLSGLAIDRFLTPPEPMRRKRRDIPPALERAILCALRLAPADRFPNATAFIRSLDGEVPPAARPSRKSVGVRIRRHPLATSLGTAAVVIVASLALRRPSTATAAHAALVPFVSDAEAAETRSSRARDTYIAGHHALAAWDLNGASRQFGAAVEADPQFAQAQLWQAQTMEWANAPYTAPSQDWKAVVDRAMTLRGRLSRHDRRLVEALSALADGRYGEACDRYGAMVAADSQDFVAWFGLGECRSKDALVVRDPSNPSGWAFRSSMHAAVNAYLRALHILPEFQEAFINLGSERLSRLLWTQSNAIRRGYAVVETGDTVYFAAFPELQGDTLAFVPHVWADLLTVIPAVVPSKVGEAITRNSRLLRQVAADWVHAVPGSSTAHLQLARALEAVGAIAPAAAGDTNGIDEARRARALAERPVQRLAAMVDETRLDIEVGRFGTARALADSVLAEGTDPAAQEAGLIATSAALTGHVHRAAALLRKTATIDTIEVAPGVREVAPEAPASEALALLAYAACGAPADSMRALADRTRQAVRTWVDPSHRLEVQRALLDWPATLAFDVVGLSPDHRSDAGANSQMARQWAMAQGDTTVERSYIVAISRTQIRVAMPGRIDPAGLFVNARLALAAKDTADAVAELDFALNALPRFGPRITASADEAAAFVRALALRADLAERAADRSGARRWAQDVTALWSGADAELQPLVTRARALGQQ